LPTPGQRRPHPSWLLLPSQTGAGDIEAQRHALEPALILFPLPTRWKAAVAVAGIQDEIVQLPPAGAPLALVMIDQGPGLGLIVDLHTLRITVKKVSRRAINLQHAH